ncbi:MAG: hypothetical protein LCH95_04140 [Proteobacteria bacterium]|nr:hypothetical protein [Pseudomonadota bacterium]
MSKLDGGRDTRLYRMGVAVAVAASLLTLWTMIVRDDGTGIGYIMLVAAAIVTAASVRFQPAGMARAMLGIAIMQLLLAALIVTAPSTATIPDGETRALLFAAFFTTLWLISAGLFRAAAKTRHQTAITDQTSGISGAP